MRNSQRWAALSAATLLVLGGAVSQAAAADAVPPVTVSGSAPAAVHGPGVVTYTYSINVPFDIASAGFTTHQPAALPALTTAVTLDGAAVPAGQISQPDSVDIAVQAGAAPTDGLTAGIHTLTYTAQVSSGPSATTTATLSLAYSVAATPSTVTSGPVAVLVDQPDLAVALTPGSGEDQLGFLGTGEHLSLAVDVKNLGYGSPASSLMIDLPVGTTLGADGVARDVDGSPLSCQPNPDPLHIVCDLGALSHSGSGNPTIDIDLTTSGAQTVGQIGAVTVSAAPNAGEGTDSAPGNNSATAHLQYTGSARLSYTITPAKTKVPLGQQTQVTLTVHNAGPQPANETIALGVLIGRNFDITGFTGNTTPPPNLIGAAAGGAPGSAAPGGPGTGGAPADMSEVVWFVGDIAAGHSASAVLSVRATALGTTRVGLLAFSTAGDPNCPNLECTLTSVPIQVVAVPVVAAVAPARAVATPVVATSGTPTLANTGAASTRVLSLGLLLLILGVTVTYASRRRPARR